MLDELKSNEETVLEAWNMIRTPGQDEVSIAKIKQFCLQVHDSSKSSKNSIYKTLCLTRSSNIVSEEQKKKAFEVN